MTLQHRLEKLHPIQSYWMHSRNIYKNGDLPHCSRHDWIVWTFGAKLSKPCLSVLDLSNHVPLSPTTSSMLNPNVLFSTKPRFGLHCTLYFCVGVAGWLLAVVWVVVEPFTSTITRPSHSPWRFYCCCFCCSDVRGAPQRNGWFTLRIARPCTRRRLARPDPSMSWLSSQRGHAALISTWQELHGTGLAELNGPAASFPVDAVVFIAFASWVWIMKEIS